jgi:hypothetical protein
MNEAGDFRLLLASRYPLVIAAVDDENRFMEVLHKAAGDLGLPVWTWTATKGLTREGQHAQYGTTDPAQGFVSELPAPGVFLFADFHHAVQDPGLVRRVKEFSQRKRPGQTLVLTGPRADIFRLHLARRERDPATFGVAELADASDDFSGAEIEAAVVRPCTAPTAPAGSSRRRMCSRSSGRPSRWPARGPKT